MLLVMAGKPVDDFIETLLPHVEKGDIIIDGGNSHFPDTNRRTKYLAGKGIRFVGTGVSGGEEGARYGPSLMPGGNEEAWPFIKDIFQSIAARVMASPAASGLVMRVLVTTSRWCTMVLSMVTWQLICESMSYNYGCTLLC